MAAVWLALGLAAAAPAPEERGAYLQKSAQSVPAPAFRARAALGRQGRLRTADGALLIGSQQGVVRRTPDGKLAPFPPDLRLPWPEVSVLAEQSPGMFWIGTPRGAIRYHAREARFEYFAGRRWLPDDRVTGIAFEGPRVVWLETPAGFGRIEWQPMTLAEKARLFEERVRARHLRHGLVAPSRLESAGDLATSRPLWADNDGLWTAVYVASQCFRYAATGAPEAREAARGGMAALLRLESITGISGFPARTFIEAGREEKPSEGEWHATPDGRWWWKGDTSSDEIVGHFLAYALFHELVADEGERAAVAAAADRVAGHILDHGLRLVDLDGQPTRWGRWSPEDLWAMPNETGLGALGLLSALKVAHQVTGRTRYLDAYRELIAKERYHLLVRNQKVNIPGRVNHSDDQLAFLSFYPLLRYETDPALRGVYLQALERSAAVERAERNPLFNFIHAAAGGRNDSARADALRTLQEIPLDLRSWTMANSHRRDLALDPVPDRFGRAQSLLVIPADERPIMRWNQNPYALDGGDGGRTEDDGAFFLLPYWLGRYHGLLEE
jgi:hypothetical protein